MPRRLALAGGVIPIAAAQQEGPLAQFSSQVQLVEVYATVTDDKGELVTGLRQNDFEVTRTISSSRYPRSPPASFR